MFLYFCLNSVSYFDEYVTTLLNIINDLSENCQQPEISPVFDAAGSPTPHHKSLCYQSMKK